jgi:signal transduction histidine kinase
LPPQVKQLEKVLHSEEVDIIQLGEEYGLLQSAQSRILIPIRRETTIMGFAFLELLAVGSNLEEVLRFLLRLSDHAAIAVSNAQLYTAIQLANSAKSEFVSFVSHELKNPMTSIKGYTELLAAGAVGPVTEAQANFLSTIRSNVDRMSTLVSDLADVSRIEAGRLRLDFKAFGIKDVINEVVRSMRRQIEEKSQTLTIQLPELPDVWADRTRVLQIVTNLVSNAHKYTPEGGLITAAAEMSANHWDAEGPRQVVHFWVQDTGIGIAEEDQEKIFQKFFRSEDPKTREVTGTGLGLNITRSLVEMQGGRIWFESEFRKGTIFHFTVPVAE